MDKRVLIQRLEVLANHIAAKGIHGDLLLRDLCKELKEEQSTWIVVHKQYWYPSVWEFEGEDAKERAYECYKEVRDRVLELEPEGFIERVYICEVTEQHGQLEEDVEWT